MTEEKFFDIPDYEGYYQITKTGVVKTQKRQGTNERILLPYTDRTGYLRVNFTVAGKTSSYAVHRLVCLTFLSNPENKRTVNHINGNKLDNNIDNLEWATHSENHLHAYRVLNRSCHMSGKTGNKHHNARAVKQISCATSEVKVFSTLTEAANNGEFCIGHISACCHGNRKQHKGFIWEFATP